MEQPSLPPPSHSGSQQPQHPHPQLQTLTSKVAIISGSCSGIGLAIAQELSSRGATVVINYPFPSLSSLSNTALSQLPSPNNGIAVEADLSTTTGPRDLVAATVAAYGKVDILVNNAALAVNLPLEDHTLEHWDTLVNLNGRGTFLLTQAVLPYLPKEGGARIVNIVSISSRAAPPMQTLYAGTKGMVDSFTRVWAKELPPKYGCTVNAVSPGPTATEGWKQAGEEMMKVLRPEIARTPVDGGRRVGEPEEIAWAVAMLCEERARWVNGTHLMVNGGLFID